MSQKFAVLKADQAPTDTPTIFVRKRDGVDMLRAGRAEKLGFRLLRLLPEQLKVVHRGAERFIYTSRAEQFPTAIYPANEFEPLLEDGNLNLGYPHPAHLEKGHGLWA